MTRLFTYLAVVTVSLAGLTPVRADPTPALPFFSKPFPTGYAVRRPSCRERRLIETPRGRRYRTVSVCEPMLRSRD